MIFLNQHNFEEHISQGLCVVHFYFEFSPPSHMQLKANRALAMYGIKEYLVDTDAASEIAVRFGIRSIPCMLLYQHGKLAGKTVGLTQISRVLDIFGIPMPHKVEQGGVNPQLRCSTCW